MCKEKKKKRRYKDKDKRLKECKRVQESQSEMEIGRTTRR